MKTISILLIFVLGCFYAHAKDAIIKVEVSTDSVLLGNYFEVKFTVENAVGEFTPPDFSDFDVVGGPNQSSSFSMINGKVSRSASYAFFLKPREEGIFYIQAASIQLEDKLLETPAVEILVVPNPDGIIENPHQLRQHRSLERDTVPSEKPVKPRRTIRL